MRRMGSKNAIGISVLGHDAPRSRLRLRSGDETTLDRRSMPVALTLVALGWSAPAAAQPIERPTNCTEAILSRGQVSGDRGAAAFKLSQISAKPQ
jgi:hypothetical protein